MEKMLLVAEENEAYGLVGDFTVAELIDFLKKLPQDALVSVYDCQKETVNRLIAVQQATLRIGMKQREEVLLWVDRETLSLPVKKP